jgi:hypothetical protein
MIDHDKIIPKLKKEDVYSDLIKEGIALNEISESLIKLLELFFENKDVLNKLPLENTGPLVNNIVYIYTNNVAFKNLQTCLNLFKYLKIKSRTELLQTLCDWEPYITEAIRRYIHVSIFDSDSKQYKEEDRIYHNFNLIGKLIEGAIKPFLMLQYKLIMLTFRSNIANESIKELTVGKLIEEIIKSENLFDIYKIKGLNLNQWRNIAIHQDYSVSEESIKCIYGSTGKRKTIVINDQELTTIVKEVIDIFAFLKTSFEIFYLDNHSYLPTVSNNIKPKKEMLLINFYTGLILKGLEMQNYSENKSEYNVSVKKINDIEIQEDTLGEILVRMWLISKKDRVILSVVDNANKSLYEATSESCEKAYKSQIKLKDIILDFRTNTEKCFSK